MQRHYEEVGTGNSSEQLVDSRPAPPSKNLPPSDKNEEEEQLAQYRYSHIDAGHSVHDVSDQGPVLHNFINSDRFFYTVFVFYRYLSRNCNDINSGLFHRWSATSAFL
jgi:hypothetical protein